MAEIHMRHLNTKFLLTDAETTLGEVGQVLSHVPPGRRTDWYVVVRLVPQGFAVISVPDLLQTVQDQGEDSLRKSLQAVPGLLVASRTVDRLAQGIGRARREMRDSPNRRLVVLEEDKPVGLLVDEHRAGGLGGSMTTLFGEEQARHDVAETPAKVRCPVDGEVYDFADVIDLATGKLICPNGHVIER